MPETVELGKLVDLNPGLGPNPGHTYEAILASAPAAPPGSELDDKKIAQKALDDTKDIPSIWFVNFPSKSAADQPAKLREYMGNVEMYRSWASLIWWRTVYNHKLIPQDDSPASKATRTAFCAKVANKHMKLTPWLAVQTDQNITKEIECEVTQFHTELITAVLRGFVGVTPTIFKTLEGILESLRMTIQQSKSNSENKMIVCERYEYIPQADVIKSYVRVISFSVSDSIREVNNYKALKTVIKCTIDYNDYEAAFNQPLWVKVAKDIIEDQLKAADDFRKKQTLDCDP